MDINTRFFTPDIDPTLKSFQKDMSLSWAIIVAIVKIADISESLSEKEIIGNTSVVFWPLNEIKIVK